MNRLRVWLFLAAGLFVAAAALWFWPVRALPSASPVPATAERARAEPSPLAATRFGGRMLFEAPPPVSGPVAPVVPAPRLAPAPQLSGIASDSRGRLAWLSLEGAPPAPVGQGEMLGVWRVLSIQDTSVRLAAEDGREVELTLFRSD